MLIEKFDEIVKLDKSIDDILSRMNESQPDSEEFAKMADQLTKLIKNKETIATLKLKAQELANKAREFEETHNLKTAEQSAKRIEVETTTAQKGRELDLRRMEILQRDTEHNESHALKLRELDLKKQESEKPDRVSKETLALIGANLAGIVAVLGYEKFNVIAGKAFGLIMRSR